MGVKQEAKSARKDQTGRGINQSHRPFKVSRLEHVISRDSLFLLSGGRVRCCFDAVVFSWRRDKQPGKFDDGLRR